MKIYLLLIVTFFSLQFISAQAPITVAQSIPLDYDSVQVKPAYLSGYNEFMNYFAKNYRAPEEEGPSGILKLSFVIEVDGSLKDIKIIKDLGSGTGQEAKRVLLKCPNWRPGEQDGKPVRVLYELPITIKG
jgi:Gram-negative bacterial TonB protein C-terminal